MPFVARCDRCGHIETARTRYFIDLCRREHDLESHGSHDSDQWTVVVVTNSDFSMIQRLSQMPAFWNAVRSPKFPRFSGLVSGEISLSAN